DAVVSRLVFALEFEFDVEPVENLSENVGYALLLENTALSYLGQQPGTRPEDNLVFCKPLISRALNKTGADTVKVPLGAVELPGKHDH
ncbi:hypothetical protein U2073_15340, partial [Listeria monocytogenes]